VAEITPVAQGGAFASANGDTNGDGTIDLSDAVYLLTWLFRDGLAPVPCPGGGPSGLPDTGQTIDFDVTCPGQDGAYATGCPMEDRFSDNGDGTVTDNCTGLMWERDTGNDGNPLKWCDALAYCQNLQLGGHLDWRLPNVRELQSIVDYGRSYPSIALAFGALNSVYWSSTSDVAGPNGAWGVYFGCGAVDVYHDDPPIPPKNSLYAVRAVRTAP
jgi:hypothetical protein